MTADRLIAATLLAFNEQLTSNSLCKMDKPHCLYASAPDLFRGFDTQDSTNYTRQYSSALLALLIVKKNPKPASEVTNVNSQGAMQKLTDLLHMYNVSAPVIV